MTSVTVVLHHDPDAGWWAESPDVAGYTAADPDLTELRRLVAEGLELFLEGPVEIDERVADGPLLSAQLNGVQAGVSTSLGARVQVVAHAAPVYMSTSMKVPASA